MTPSQDTLKLLRRWTSANRGLAEAKHQLNSAECELLNSESELAKFLLPEDACKGESFHIWIGDGLLSVTRDGDNRHQVEWRKEPSAAVKVEMQL